MKKKMFILGVCILWLQLFSGFAYASDEKYELSVGSNNEKQQMLTKLVENGYTEETAEALQDDELQIVYNSILENNNLNINTSASEVDMLLQIEEFMSLDDETLKKMGVTQGYIDKTREQLNKMFSMSDDELVEKYGIDLTKIKMLRMAKENANRNSSKGNGRTKEVYNLVQASGSISSSTLVLSQIVVPVINYGYPYYMVVISYAWDSAYLMTLFDDKIVCAWGGNLNVIGEQGTANYYEYSHFTYAWQEKVWSSPMKTNESIQKGITFSFEQFDPILKDKKTKSGSASFSLYQKGGYKGYDTKVITQYCHHIVSAQSASISITGVPSITVGGAYDTSPQKKTVISY